MNADSKPPRTSWPRRIFVVVRSVLVFAVVGFTIGWLLNRLNSHFESRPEPAGFPRGLVQGALMPIAMPNLLFGQDVAIYATRNTGRTYRLGYTMGVNGCGLLFFGLFFWRVRRMKAQITGP